MGRMRYFHRALAVGAFLLSSACGQVSESLEQSALPLLNGEASGVEDNEVVKVIAVQPDKTTHVCTGTLIAPNLVITARHCVVNSNSLPFSCTIDGELVTSSAGGRLGAPVAPENIAFHVGPEFKTPVAAVGAKLFSTDSTTSCRNDIAVMLLDRDITDAPIAAIRLGGGVKRGEAMSLMGYGWDENGDSGVRRRRGGIEVEAVGESEFNDTPDLTPPRTFVTPGPVLCVGDSGGPAFGSQGEVVGVWSAVVGDCEDPDSKNVFTQVAPFEDLVLKPAFEASGYEPIVAELPPDEGEGGTGNVDSGGSSTDTGGTEASGGTTGEEPVAGSAGTTGGNKTAPRKKRDTDGCSTVPGRTETPAALVAAGFMALVASRRRRR